MNFKNFRQLKEVELNEKSSVLTSEEKEQMRKDALKMSGNAWSKKYPIGDYEDYKNQAKRVQKDN